MSSIMNRFILMLGMFCALTHTATPSSGMQTNLTPAAALLNATAKDITQAYKLLDLLKARTTQLHAATQEAQPHKQLITNFDALHNEMKAGVMPVLGTTQFTAPEQLIARGMKAIQVMKRFVQQIRILTGQTDEAPITPPTPAITKITTPTPLPVPVATTPEPVQDSAPISVSMPTPQVITAPEPDEDEIDEPSTPQTPPTPPAMIAEPVTKSTESALNVTYDMSSEMPADQMPADEIVTTPEEDAGPPAVQEPIEVTKIEPLPLPAAEMPTPPAPPAPLPADAMPETTPTPPAPPAPPAPMPADVAVEEAQEQTSMPAPPPPPAPMPIPEKKTVKVSQPPSE